MTIEIKLTIKIDGKKKSPTKTNKGQTQSNSQATAIIIQK